jgi:hypothetical protein
VGRDHGSLRGTAGEENGRASCRAPGRNELRP